MRNKREMQFPSVTKVLCKERTNERVEFTMRPFAPGDELGMIACIRDEYRDSYFKREFYDPEKLFQKALGDHYVFFVAEAKKEIAGMEIFALFTENGDDYIEPASQILKRDYRGYGLAAELVAYTFPLAKAMKPKALFVHAVTFHPITQRVCGDQGMVPTGFRLGSFLAERMHNSYPKGNCPKHSEGIMILPVEKQAAGKVYLPRELSDYAARCYERLGMRCTLCHERAYLPQEPAILDVNTDEQQRTVLMRIVQSGSDLVTQVRQIMDAHGQPYWTYQITVSADCGYAVAEYEQLWEIGFFFTGLKAACGEKEQFYMQWCGDMELHMEDYALTDDFRVLRDEIHSFYDRRREV